MARVYNGSTQYSQSSAPIAVVPCTIATWFYADSTIGSFQYPMNWSNSAHSSVLSIISSYPSGTQLSGQLDFGPSSTYFPTGSGTFSASTWNHAAVVVESGKARTYLNGAAGSDVTWGGAEIFSDTSLFTFGRPGDVASSYFAGRLAFAAVWSVALTQADVDALYSGVRHPRMVRPDAIIAAWDFGGFSGENDVDHVGGYDLTSYNSPTFADGPRLWYPDEAEVIVPASVAPAASYPHGLLPLLGVG